MKYAKFGDVSFQMQPRQASRALGELFFLDCALVTQYKQEWFRTLDDVFMVNAQFDPRLFRQALTREPSLLTTVQTWSSVSPSHATVVD